VLYYLTDRPSEAAWLTREERTWLTARLTSEQRNREASQTYSVKQAVTDPKVLALAVVYFGAVATNYGLSFFLPQIVKAFGLGSNITVGFVTAIPYVIGTIGMVLWGLSSDRSRERKGHVAFALFVSAAGICVAALMDDPTIKMLCLGIAGFGIFASLPVFWTLPTAFLSGPAAAGGIAIINSIGNLSGFAGPFAMGWIRDQTGSYTGGLLTIAATAVIAMVVVILLRHDSALERAPSKVAAE
jgi:nitrate/nitrite transporter NarK